MLMLRWDRSTDQYGPGKTAYLNNSNFKAFVVFWDGSTSKVDPEKHKLICNMPGYKENMGHFTTEDLAIAYAENAYAKWLLKTGLRDTQ